MILCIDPCGLIRTLYGEEIDLSVLGQSSIRRGSYVEPNDSGRWVADLSPGSGPALGPFDARSQALAAEAAWLEKNWLVGSDGR